MERELTNKKKIIKVLKERFGDERVFEINTKGYNLSPFNKIRKRACAKSTWANETFEEIYKSNRKDLKTDTYHFSYIKFAVDKDNNEVYGLVSGKSSFHHRYPSDVWFYDLHDENETKLAAKYCDHNALEWYSEEILIIKNEDDKNRQEAFDNEKIMKNLFNLFD